MKFVYLVQGQADRIVGYFHLNERKNAYALFLSYDIRIDGALYFPDSTWAEGRNLLLEKAKEKFNGVTYYIFVDDDTEFYLGNWSKLESELQQYKPLLAVPVFDRTAKKILPYPLFPIQRFSFHDEQLLAIDSKVIEEGIVTPYQTQFDDLHWWATCRLQQILIHHFYSKNAIQLNSVRVANLQHDRYLIKNHSDEHYREEVLQYCRLKYGNSVKDIDKNISRFLLFIKTLRYIFFSKNGYKSLSLKAIFSQVLISFQRENVVSIDKLLGTINSNDGPFILYGFGDIGQKIYYALNEKEHYKIPLVVDKKAFEGNLTIGNVTVKSPINITNYENPIIVVATLSFKREIMSYLIHSLGIDKSRLVFIY
ncbi:hypothetical protein KO519_16955 [Paraglaciecola agarilytica]|uniref:hypothetical protein n=1 Tax=Paraglaciecola chathamensis TaxID=368405 RepID=UPI001C083C29|nr:hypothetical protein [Paraglaciecola agarilytica]MBU3019372.1 hypothetical protein [Paraglaciecola agarilytica]